MAIHIPFSIYSSTGGTDPSASLCKDCCSMTRTGPENYPPNGRKRKQAAIKGVRSPQPLGKGRVDLSQLRHETYTAYWDSLSKLWLTHRALNELDRRNKQNASPVRVTPAHRLDLDGETDSFKYPSQKLKRFAKHGGPDLRDLGGVSLARETSRSLLI